MDALWDKLYELDPSLKAESIKPEDTIEESVYLVDVIKDSDKETQLNDEELEFLKANLDSNGALDTLKFYNDPIDVKSGKLFGIIETNKVLTSDEVKQSEMKETRHIEINFSSQEINYRPGDVCCIIPQNNIEIIHSFLESAHLEPNDLLRIRPNPEAISSSIPMKFPMLISATELFEYWLDTLGVPNRYFFKVLSHFTDDEVRREKLLILCSKTSDGKNEYYRYCHREKRTHLEILHDFNTSKLPLEYLIQLIGAQKPREFSISSSQLVHPQSLHLTMGVLRYLTIGHKREKKGVCSSYLSQLPVSVDTRVL